MEHLDDIEINRYFETLIVHWPNPRDRERVKAIRDIAVKIIIRNRTKYLTEEVIDRFIDLSCKLKNPRRFGEASLEEELELEHLHKLVQPDGSTGSMAAPVEPRGVGRVILNIQHIAQVKQVPLSNLS